MPEINRTIQTANFSSDYVSVKDFGAVGDGVTDDTAAIQAALSAAAGKTLNTVSGEIYLIDTTSTVGLLLDTDYTKIVGGGKFLASNSTSHLCSITADDCAIEGVIMEGDGTFLSTVTADDDRIALIKVTGERATIRDNVLIKARQNFIHFNNVTSGIASGNKIQGGISSYTSSDTYYQGIRASDCSGLIVTDNIIESLDGGKCAEGINIAPADQGINEGHVIHGNQIKDAHDHAIYLNVAYGCSIEGNITNSDAAGIVCASKFDITLVTEYAGNICKGNVCNATAGVSAGNPGIYLREPNNTICEGNKIFGYPRGISITPVTYSDANLTMNNNVISNNVVQGFESFGILIGAAGLTVGDISGNIIEGNRLVGTNDTAGIGISASLATGILNKNQIINNFITKAGSAGIKTGFDTHSIYSGNFLLNPCVSGGTDLTGIFVLDGISLDIKDNKILDELGAPVMLYGIDGNNDSDNCVISGNTIKNAQTVAIRRMQFASHKNTFYGNKSGDDALAGVLTLSSGTSTVVTNDNANQGQGYTSYIMLTPVDSNAASIVPYISARSPGTSITLGHASAAGTEQYTYEIVQ